MSLRQTDRATQCQTFTYSSFQKSVLKFIEHQQLYIFKIIWKMFVNLNYFYNLCIQLT